MRKTLHLPAKRPSITLAQYASVLPKPLPPFVAVQDPARSRLFDVQGQASVRLARVTKARPVAPGTISPLYPTLPFAGGFDRPDFSTPVTSLTFKWSPT